jgi:hypothetical protein
MAAAKIANSATLRKLIDRAETRGDRFPAPEALGLFPESGEHIGVVVRVEDTEALPAEAEGLARAWVVWLLQLTGDDGRYMVVMVSAVSEVYDLPDVEVTDDIARMAVEFARETHGEMEFSVQPRAQGLRLVRVVSGQPGLCVRCKSNAPAVTDDKLLLAPEGPVCAGCLNMSEQLKWGEAALRVLRNSGASREKIAEVQEQISQLRGQMGSGQP